MLWLLAKLMSDKDIKKLVDEEYKSIMKAPLEDFLEEAFDLGYSVFWKDIVKKVIAARVQQKK